MDTPSYTTLDIRGLVKPHGREPKGRRVWSIDLETVWLPFFTATNVTGDTRIPSEALGAPLRLAYDADGSVRFSKTGRPVTKVAKEIGDSVRNVRDNFTAGLLGHAHGVIASNPEGYKAQVELARQAGEPILTRDRENLQQAMLAQMEAAAEAEHKEAVAVTA